jgi:hypothetical protein
VRAPLSIVYSTVLLKQKIIDMQRKAFRFKIELSQKKYIISDYETVLDTITNHNKRYFGAET